MAASLSVFTLYRDPAAAVTWLVEAFGFEICNQYGAEEVRWTTPNSGSATRW